MTLCIGWRERGMVHFASDSRLTVAANSYADVAIKILSVPCTILEPMDANQPGPRAAAWTGELGLCFAGSVVNSLTLKESLVEIIRTLQYAPGYTDITLEGLARYIFTIYQQISQELCATSIGERGRATLLLGGQDTQSKEVRVFRFSTDRHNVSSMAEVLKREGEYVLLGSGEPAARRLLAADLGSARLMSVLKAVIDDREERTVGGHMQYGRFEGSKFTVFGVAERAESGVHYWRAAIDLNSERLVTTEHVLPGLPFVDPFGEFM